MPARAKKTLRDVSWKGRRALVRVDFNVPLRDGQVADDTRIRAALPTLEHLRSRADVVILLSHLGRPKGKPDPAYSLRPVAARLESLWGTAVQFHEQASGAEVRESVRRAGQGTVHLLENTRFEPGETANDSGLAQAWAGLGDVFVSDAFGSAHRAHASTVGVAAYLPSVAGLLMEREIRYLSLALDAPEHPYLMILGGAKVSDKIGVIRNLLPRVDVFLLGGGMANTFLASQGVAMGQSLIEAEAIDTARELLREAAGRFRLPVDLVVSDQVAQGAEHRVVPVGEVPPDWRAVDIGPRTMAIFQQALAEARLIVWNGPVGVFEIPAFSEGTRGVAHALADSSATTIVGGGDSAAAVAALGMSDRFSHVSTGGGASLEFLEGKTLPGIAVLEDAETNRSEPDES